MLAAPALLSANAKGHYALFNNCILTEPVFATDTTTSAKKHPQEPDDKKKVKEIGKAKRQPKPEKLVPADAAPIPKPKPKRERRPEGLERPPEIPRRNGGG